MTGYDRRSPLKHMVVLGAAGEELLRIPIAPQADPIKWAKAAFQAIEGWSRDSDGTIMTNWRIE